MLTTIQIQIILSFFCWRIDYMLTKQISCYSFLFLTKSHLRRENNSSSCFLFYVRLRLYFHFNFRMLLLWSSISFGCNIHSLEASIVRSFFMCAADRFFYIVHVKHRWDRWAWCGPFGNVGTFEDTVFRQSTTNWYGVRLPPMWWSCVELAVTSVGLGSNLVNVYLLCVRLEQTTNLNCNVVQQRYWK